MKIFVEELKEGEFITDQVFSIEEIQQHKTRKNNPYYRLTLQDRTGEIAAKIWEDDFANCHVRNVERGDVVKIDAQVQKYNDILQLIIQKLEKTEDYDITELLQTSDKDLDQMFADIKKETDELRNSFLQKLMKNLFNDEDFVKRFKRSPAAVMVHHDYIGGLMEHNLEMINIAKAQLSSYPEASKDLVIVGCILHDVGKVFEIEVKKTAMQKTKPGWLIGHVVQGYEFVKSKLPEKFPQNLWMKLGHIIISHQGEVEYGSPIKPAMLEAAIVHGADYASNIAKQYQRALQLGEGKEPGFSEYQRWIKTQVYVE